MYFQNETDLLIELINRNKLEVTDFKSNQIEEHSKIYKLDAFEVKNDEQSKKLDRPKGRYRLITIKDIRTISSAGISKLVKIIAREISIFTGKLTKKDTVLICGLGNEEIESDSLGKMVANNVIVTRLFDEQNKMPSVCAISPSVMGVTGIETADIISSIANKIKPKLIIVIDSLCASSYDRLGTSIQITDVGLVPGGGVNRPKKPINKDSFGCDVITIGVPLMIFAKTLSEGNSHVDENLVVTFHDIGFIVSKLSNLLARAINYSILGVEKLY